jgi:hypothetical protein
MMTANNALERAAKEVVVDYFTVLYYLSICSRGLSVQLGRESNPGTFDYEVEALATQPRLSYLGKNTSQMESFASGEANLSVVKKATYDSVLATHSLSLGSDVCCGRTYGLRQNYKDLTLHTVAF